MMTPITNLRTSSWASLAVVLFASLVTGQSLDPNAPSIPQRDPGALTAPPETLEGMAPSIAFGQTVEGEITAPGETREYRFTATAGQHVYWDAAASVGSLNWYVEDAYGRRVALNFTAVTDLGPTPLMGGEYRIVVLGESGGTGEFTFELVDATPQSFIGTIDGAPLVGSLSNPGGVHEWTLSSTPGQSLYIEVVSVTSAGALNFELIDDLGRTLLPRTTSLVDSGPFTLAGGDHTLKVLSENGGTGDYEVRVRSHTSSSEAITIGQVVTAALDPSGDVDRYLFPAMAGQRLVLDRIVVDPSGNVRWTVTDPLGQVVYDVTGGVQEGSPIVAVDGDYTLTVQRAQSGTVSYEFRVIEVEDDLSSTSIGSTIVGEIELPSEVDRYEFSASAGQRIYLDVIAASSAGSINWSLVDSLGRQVSGSTSSVADSGPYELVGGDYVLSILSESGGVSTYEIALADVVDSSSTIAIGDTVVGSIAIPGQEVHYAWNVPVGRRVTLDVIGSTAAGGIDFILVDPVGREIVRTTSLLDVTLDLVGGDYTLTLDGEFATTGDYEFQVIDGGPAPHVPAGTVVAVGSAVADQISVPGEVDAYTFTVGAGEIVLVDLLAGQSTLRWTLLDPAGQAIFQTVQASSPSTQNQGPFTLAAGTYQLSLFDTGSGTPSYEFQLVSVMDDSGTLALDVPQSASIDTPGQRDRYTLDLASGERVFLDLLSGAGALRWTLLDPAGQPIFESAQASSTSSQNQGPWELAAGTYSLEVWATGDVVTPYEFSFVTVVDLDLTTSLGTAESGTIPSPAGRVRYAIDLADPTAIYCDLTTAASALRWSLFDPSGNALFQDAFATSATSSDQGPIMLPAGVSVLEVSATGDWVVDYGFVVREAIDSATPLSLDTPFSETFPAAGTTRRFTVDLTSGPTRIFFDNQVGANGLLATLVDPYGGTVFSATISSPGSDQGPWTLAAGEYELVITSTGGLTPAYGFELVEVIDQAESLARETVVEGTVVTPAGRTRYSFDVTEAEYRVFDLIESAPGVRWTLEDEVGSSAGFMSYVPAVNPGSDDRGPFHLAPGSYTLTFETDNETAASFAFRKRFGTVPVPVAVELDWSLNRSIGVSFAQSARFHPNGDLWVGNRVGGVFRVGDEGFPELVTTAGPVSGLMTTEAGDVFYAEDGAGIVRRVGSSGSWVLGFHAGDDDPIGLRAAPSGYAGPLPIAGQGLMIDAGFDGEDGVWAFSLSASGSGTEIVGDSSPLERGVDLLFVGDDLYLADEGPEGGTGTLWRVEAGGLLTDMGVTGLVPMGLALDPLSDDVLVLDRLGRRVVRWTPGTTTTSDVITGVRLSLSAGWAGLDVSADGRRLAISAEDNIWLFSRCGLAFGGIDCNGNGIADDCDLEQAMSQDCNGNGIPDECDIASGTSADLNFDGVPDECLPCALVDVVFIMDTSGSMAGEAVALCSLLPQVVEVLTAAGIDVSALLLGVTVAPGGGFSCLTGNVRDLLGGSVGSDCLGTIAGGAEDWGRATAAVAEFYDWRPGAVRLVVPISDEGPHCGDGITAEDSIDIDTAIDTAFDFGVIVSPITGDGSSQAVLDFAAELAAGTGGLTFSSEESSDAIGESILQIVLGSCPCGVSLSSISPASGSTFPVGTPLTLSGRATAIDPSEPLVAVLVDGVPAQSVDLSGRFFHPITVGPGPQSIDIQILQGCGSTEITVTLNGVEAGTTLLDTYSDVTFQVSPTYSGTTFNPGISTLLADVVLCNDATEDRLHGPLLFVIEEFAEASVSLANPDGVTELGDPYVRFDLPNGFLEPGECSPALRLALSTPQQVAVDFDYRVLAPDNAPPVFGSLPIVSTVAGGPYTYGASAFDPEGDVVTYSRVLGPEGLTIDPSTGVVSWAPLLSDLGVHNVRIAAEDERGGRTEQAFTLSVVEAIANRPPSFTSVPVTQSAVGAQYSYAATAFDLDGDPLSFSKVNGPADLFVAPDGGVTWAFATPGIHPITVRVEDGQGGQADQSYLLAAGAVSLNPHAPSLFGSPSGEAVIGQLYLYQPVATDADGDALGYTLPVAPVGMTVDPDNGRVTWVPAVDQVGPHAVTLLVSDGGGGDISQSWTIDAASELANRAPVIESVPRLFVEVDTTYQYFVSAFDPDFDPVTYSLVAPPAGMAIDPSSGELTWTPTVTGTSLVSVRAADPDGAVGHQVFALEVIPPNTAPTIDSTPVTTATVGAVYQYAVSADDADGHALAFSLDAAPAGMQIGATSGVVNWAPSAAQVGVQPVTVRVTDLYGASATQSFDVGVQPDASPPVVIVVATANPTPPGEPVTIQVQAADDVQVVSRSLSVGGVPVTLGALHQYTFTPVATGVIELEATATDASGNVGTGSLDLAVLDASSDPTEVTLISPAPDALITAPTEIVATIQDDDPTGLEWTVSYRPDGRDESTEIATGAGEVEAGVVALFDPTKIPNGTYWIQIIGRKAGFQTGGIESRVQVTGEFKLGRFSFTMTDLTIPLAGIPLTITRRYDSLDPSPGDFGPGWSLGLSGDVSDDSVERFHPVPLVDLLDDEPFRQNARVYVTLIDGRRVGFTFQPESTSVPFVWRTKFVPDEGVEEELEAITDSGSGFVYGFSDGYYEFIVPYNPSRYVVTTQEGLKLTLHEQNGLERIEDVFGNFIDVEDDGLHSSTGVSIAFERGKRGSITRIIPPLATPGGRQHDLEYVYDPGTGNLIASRDMADYETTYDYDHLALPHHLTAVNDPLGRPLVRTVYDEEGRAIAQCNAEGNVDTLEGCFEFSVDPVSRTQTIVDGNGNQVDLFFDEDGNVVVESQIVPGEDPLFTFRTFDDDGNLLTETDPASNVYSYTYDEDGNPLTATDSAGRTWTYAYDEAGNRTLECDPDGNCTQVVYDDRRKPVLRTDPLGNQEVYVWNERGQRTEIHDPNGNTWLFAYNPAGRLEQTNHPDGSTSHFEYDGLGRLTMYTDRRGRTSTFTYTPGGLVTTETWLGSTPPELITYEYDAVGNITRATSSRSDVTMDYWPTGLVKTVHSAPVLGSTESVIAYGYDNGGLEIASGYDGNGNITHVSDSFGGQSEYTYDYRNSVTSIRQVATDPTLLLPGAVASPVVERSVTLEYDLGGLLRTIRRYEDPDRLQAGPSTHYDYDCAGCPTRISMIDHRDPVADTSLHLMTFERDDRGDVTQMSDAEGDHLFAYDGMRRLLSVDRPAAPGLVDEFYSYDSVGNRTGSHSSAAYQYGYQGPDLVGNELLADDQFTYEYDANGNLSRKTSLADGSYTDYEHDFRNRLTSVVHSDGTDTLLWEAEYVYDAANRRIRSEENGVVRQYVYDRAHPILVLDGAGNLIKRRLYGESLDFALGYSTPTEGYWYLTGPKRSVRDIVDDSRSIVRHYVYDSFGRIVDTTGSVEDDIRFQSREFSDLTGLGYFRARHYDPVVGRFVEEDPLNPYRYDFSYNNPLSFIDPTGEVAAIEFACKVVSSLATVSTVLSITNPTAELWNVVVEAVCNLEGGPDVGQGAARDFQQKINKAVVDMFLEQLAESLGVGCEWKASQLLLNPPTWVPPSGC